ncbi:MAG: type III-B CRISPR module RAMP protein Cmr6 [Clostridia bacterium]|nr:type III-B CRISPR module RAMP protein Cmr6 [Clostridia bacterium]
MKTNLNLLFNKTYYDFFDNTSRPDFNKDHFLDEMKKSLEGKNKALFEADFYYKDDYVENPCVKKEHCFDLKTTYPGAIIGIGYTHGTGIEGLDNDINCGFSFDFVSGQPYYPATSVKGVLRSAFEHKDLITSFLPETKKDVDLNLLEKSIFGDDDEKCAGVDVFFDAVVKFVIRTDDKKKKNLLSSEYITSHGDDPTKNPVPVMITKILPNVVFEFRFNLSDSVIGEKTIEATEKKELFKNILKVLGIGAKTNVGYGALAELESLIPADNLNADDREADYNRMGVRVQEDQNDNRAVHQGGNERNEQRNNNSGHQGRNERNDQRNNSSGHQGGNGRNEQRNNSSGHQGDYGKNNFQNKNPSKQGKQKESVVYTSKEEKSEEITPKRGESYECIVKNPMGNLVTLAVGKKELTVKLKDKVESQQKIKVKPQQKIKIKIIEEGAIPEAIVIK